MAKEFPYFKFELAEYLAGSIQFCSMAAQGLFTTIQCLYWQRNCELTIEQINNRFRMPDLVDELLKQKIIKVKDGKILIQWLKSQFTESIKTSVENTANGKKGAEKRWR